MTQPTNPAAPPAPVDLDALDALEALMEKADLQDVRLSKRCCSSILARMDGQTVGIGVMHSRDDGELFVALFQAAPALIAEARAKRAAEQERDDAQMRLGTLGLKPNLAPDLVDLVTRLGTMIIPSHKTWPTHYRNPDGPEAAAAIEGLNARVKALEEALRPLLAIVDRMTYSYGYPAADIAADLEQQKPNVLSILRALEALGLAHRHPFFSEDENLIRGSGYSLTRKGNSFRTALKGSSHAD